MTTNSGVLTSLLLPHLSSSLTDSLPSLNLLCHSKTDARFMQDGQKAVWSIPYVSVAFFPSLKQNFIAYLSSKVSSRPDCIFEIYQLWQSGISMVYSNSCCRYSFEPEIIKICQSSHKIYSNNILNFQESTTILNACIKMSGNLLNAPRNFNKEIDWIGRKNTKDRIKKSHNEDEHHDFKSCIFVLRLCIRPYFSSSVPHVLSFLIWIVLQMRGRWPYSCCFVGRCFQELFSIACNLRVQFPSSFFSKRLVSIYVVHPMTPTHGRACFGRNLSIAIVYGHRVLSGIPVGSDGL